MTADRIDEFGCRRCTVCGRPTSRERAGADYARYGKPEPRCACQDHEEGTP